MPKLKTIKTTSPHTFTKEAERVVEDKLKRTLNQKPRELTNEVWQEIRQRGQAKLQALKKTRHAS